MNNEMEMITAEETAFAEKEEKSPLLTVCFVCTGNTCRSPMAAAVLNALGKERGIVAQSAGLCVQAGAPISTNAALALTEAGILPTAENDYPHHTARPVNRALLERSDRIVGISSSHAMTLMADYPAYAAKILSMPQDICDPFGGDLAVYRRCLAEITAGIRSLFFFEEEKSE